MAFHGIRGGPRGRGTNSGPRGRGRGGNMGAPRGHSRGRGRGTFGGGRGKPMFDSARIAQQKEKEEYSESESNSEDMSEQEEVGNEEQTSSEDEDEEPPTVNSYVALMQSLVDDSAPPLKRRKLDRLPKLEGTEKNRSELEEATNVEDIDHVEEPEEGPETAIDDMSGDVDTNEPEDTSDPFEVHFADPHQNVLEERLNCLREHRWKTHKIQLQTGSIATISYPQKEDIEHNLPQVVTAPDDLKLKQKLVAANTKHKPSFDALESSVAPFIFGNQDVLFCERSPTNSDSLRRLTCLHAINHIFKTRDRVIKNNARLSVEKSGDELDLRDQGFTRPKVLMILPTRESCVRMVNMIVSLCEPEQQENRKRFDDSYVVKEEKFSSDKTDDFRELFAGNDDDMFRLGLKFTRKTIKYFSQFYNSDIILASPLGLRMALEGTEEKKGDYDFLSSIEVVIVDQADALLMQNWEHVEYIFEHLNLQPKEAHGCDFSRVRSWYLDNHAKYFRQTITLTAYNTPEINTLLYNHSQNWAAKVKISRAYPGAIRELDLKIKQTFSRLESESLVSDPDARFTYFTTAIIPTLTRRVKDSVGTLILIPSYLDFVGVRNYFSTAPATSSLSFGCISEYTSIRDVARARSHFFTGRHSVLLYSERAHHFRRYQIRGVKRVIMYGLPDNPIFYKEIVGGYLGRSLQEGKLAPGEGSVRVIFSESDILKLERIAGTERLRKMIMEKGDTFDFFK